MRAKYLASIALVPWALMSSAMAEPTQASVGRERAIEGCSACHQVTSSQTPPAPVPNPDALELVPAPSFAHIAAKYRGRDKELRAFIKAPLHPMKEQRFLDADLNAIVAYIRSLDKNPR